MADDSSRARIFVTQVEREVPIIETDEQTARSMTIPEENTHESISIELHPDKLASKIGKTLSKYFLKSSDKEVKKDQHNYDIFLVDFLKLLKRRIPDYDIKIQNNIQQVTKLLMKFGFKVKGHFIQGLRLKSAQ